MTDTPAPVDISPEAVANAYADLMAARVKPESVWAVRTAGDTLQALRLALTASEKRLNFLEQERLEGKRKGFQWDTWRYTTDKPIGSQLDAAILAKG